jgi:hypothetical protein
MLVAPIPARSTRRRHDPADLTLKDGVLNPERLVDITRTAPRAHATVTTGR